MKNKYPKPKDNPDLSNLIELVKSGIKSLSKTGSTPKDFEHYVFEEAVEAIYGHEIWEWWNEHY